MAVQILIQFKKSPWGRNGQYSQKSLYLDPKTRLGVGNIVGIVKQGEVELQGKAGLCKDRSYDICVLLRKTKDPEFKEHKSGSELPLLTLVRA